MERAYPLFSALEAFTDGFGGWKVVDVLGKPWLELDEDLADDLLTCKRIAGIVEYQNKNAEGEPEEKAVIGHK
jgi:hypothetical protein